MASKSAIEWTEASWSPVTGCTRVSPGCQNCYAETLTATRLADHPRYKGLAVMVEGDGERFPRWTNEVRCHDDVLAEPLRWRKPRRIFVNSMSDTFHADVPFEFIDHIFAVMALCQQHTFQVLTKRPERMAEYCKYATQFDNLEEEIGRRAGWEGKWPMPTEGDWPFPNIWLGASAENQAELERRIGPLLRCPAAVRWLSVEPMLGAIDAKRFIPQGGPLGGWYLARCEHCGYTASTEFFDESRNHDDADVVCPECQRTCCANKVPGINWVVCGAESGPGARPMDPDWARSLRDQCRSAGVPFFMKQMCDDRGRKIPFEEWPSDLKVREWPDKANRKDGAE